MKILITPAYNTYIEVNGKLLEDIAKCKMYKQQYGDGDYEYIACNDKLEIRTANDDQIFPSKEIYKSHRDLIDDNKALLKELEELKERMNTQSTDLILED
jgi:hypothetical protein